MGRRITDYEGTIIAPGGDYPNGNIKDNPNGTRINSKSNADIQQFFQRIAADAGLTLNGLADNLTNGFQYVQALNTLFFRADSALAATVGASGFTAVNVSGMAVSGSTTIAVTAGFFYYNGQFVLFQGGSVTPTAGAVAYVNISTLDALPIATLGQHPSSTADGATTFKLSNLQSYLTTANLQAQINALPPSAWITATLNTNYLNSQPVKFTKDGLGYVTIEGNVTCNGSVPSSTTVFTLPAGYRPLQEMTFSVTAFEGSGGGGFKPGWIVVKTDGSVVISNSTFSFVGAAAFVSFDGFKFPANI